MTSAIPEAFRAVVQAYPLVNTTSIAYGTAGFRTHGALLPPVAARMAALIALRLVSVAQTHATASSGHGDVRLGCMITASHNAAVDNGFKIVDYDAGMLSRAWEPLATAIANAADADSLIAALPAESAAVLANWDAHRAALDEKKALVVIGRDTRPTGQAMFDAIAAGLKAFGIAFASVGLVTTPELHFHVWNHTPVNVMSALATSSDAENPWSDVIVQSYAALVEDVTTIKPRWASVDCANGVGALSVAKLERSMTKVSAALGRPLNLRLLPTNTDTTNFALLNHECGADYTQKSKRLAASQWQGLEALLAAANAEADVPVVNCYSIDGDADRLVAFKALRDGKQVLPADQAVLIDGDRLIVLYASLIQQLASKLVDAGVTAPRIGVVQTAYANGGSTRYIREVLRLEVVLTATGVKYLHPAAAEFDIGLYFEANGHGTVLFGDGSHGGASYVAVLEEAAARGIAAAARLLQIRGVLSQCCGDAFSNIYAAEVALQRLGWGFDEWLGCYPDLPSVQIKVSSSNHSVIKTTPDETRALEPAGLQDSIDEAVRRVGGKAGRSFVRPSGTEPIIRVYAEAETAEECRALGSEVVEIVKRFCP